MSRKHSFPRLRLIHSLEPDPPQPYPSHQETVAAPTALDRVREGIAKRSAPLSLAQVGLLAPTLLAGLPLATTLHCVVELPTTLAGQVHVKRGFYVTTGRAIYQRMRLDAAVAREAAGSAAVEPVLAGRELGALAIGAENGRAAAQWLALWLGHKADAPELTLDVATVLGGLSEIEAQALAPAARWPLARVALAWGFVVEAVAVGDSDPLTWCEEV